MIGKKNWMLWPNFGPLAFNLILQGLKCKIKISEIYFDKKCDLSTCVKIRDYNVLLSFYLYLQDNPCLQDNDSYLLLNLILNQIQTSKKKMSLIKTLFLPRWKNILLSFYLYLHHCWKNRINILNLIT